MPGMDQTDRDPLADARALVAERFPAARAAFLGGNVLSPRRTATSDLDIVILIDGPPAPYRESLHWRGWPAELFVQDQRLIGEWLAKDTARRRPTLARLCAEGEILLDFDGTGQAVRGQARAVLEGLADSGRVARYGEMAAARTAGGRPPARGGTDRGQRPTGRAGGRREPGSRPGRRPALGRLPPDRPGRPAQPDPPDRPDRPDRPEPIATNAAPGQRTRARQVRRR